MKDSNLVTPTKKSTTSLSSLVLNTSEYTTSKKDKQLSSVLYLKNFSCPIQDVSKELEYLADVLFGNDIQNRKLYSARRSLRVTISECSKILAPIPSTEYIHKTKERDRRDEPAKVVNCRKTLPLRLIESNWRCVQTIN